MSLYDNWQASVHKGAPSQQGPTAESCNSVPETPAAGSQIVTVFHTFKTNVVMYVLKIKFTFKISLVFSPKQDQRL